MSAVHLRSNDTVHDHSRQQFRVGILLLLLTLIVGPVGYMLLEGWDFLDAMYMTVISVTTTGFEEVHHLSAAGRIFTLFLIVSGVGSLAYTGGRAVQILFETQLFRRRRMTRQLSALRDHYIVCGYGKMGKYICEELAENKAAFVVVETDPAKVEAAQESGYVSLQGDATSDDMLEEAQIARAKGLVAVLDSDADNVFATLSAKALNPAIFVVARAVEEETEPKLLKAGANRVVKPYETAGTKMAELLLRPSVIEFIDIVARDKSVDLNIEEVRLAERSALRNKTLADANLHRDLNIIVVTITKQDGTFIYNPQSSAVLEAGDRLIVLGERAQLVQLTTLCAGS
jgi:voltage-gated potassium channel